MGAISWMVGDTFAASNALDALLLPAIVQTICIGPLTVIAHLRTMSAFSRGRVITRENSGWRGMTGFS